MEWAFGIIGLLAGAAIGAAAILLRSLSKRAESQTEMANLRARAEATTGQAQQLLLEIKSLRDAVQIAEGKREAAEKQAAVIEQQLKATHAQFAEQKRLLDEAEKKLTDTFASVGGKALRDNNAQFIELATQTFAKLMKEASGDVEKKQQAIDNLIKPIRELLEKQNLAVGEIEKKRETAYVRLDEQIKVIAQSHEKLSGETGKLVKALRRPEQRGRWGEMQLRNAVEMAGMTEHCDFNEQVSMDGQDGTQRPDMVVKLPGGGVIMVDAKVALDAYLDAIESETDRSALLARHARQVEDHCTKLAAKGYWQLDCAGRTPKVVVLFMPLESALIAALETKPQLQADAMRNHVLIATPTLLVALLRAVAYGWQQEDVAANAREISQTGQELYARLSTFVDNLESVGRGINSTAGAYNKAIGSLEGRVLPSARKLKDLHATTDAEIESPNPIEIEIRPIVSPELKSLPS